MSRYCRICRNTACANHGKDITLLGEGYQCNYIPVPTNADRIRAMSDEELADYFAEIGSEVNNGTIYSDRPEEWLEYLKQPAEKGD